MMDFMARKGVTLSRSGVKKRRMPEAYSRPMPKAARIKLEMKMEAEAEEGPDSDEEMMALLDPSGNGTSATDSRNVQVWKGQLTTVRASGHSFSWFEM